MNIAAISLRFAGLATVLLCLGSGISWADDLASVVVQIKPVALGFASDGILEARQQAVVAAQVSGRILEVRVDAGQSVRKGDVLMRIDAREAAESAAAAEARYVNARLSFERSERLVAQKFLSPAALDKARSDFDAAAANRAAARAGLSHATVVAPISGIVARRHAEAGEMAAPGRELVTIYLPGSLRAVATIPQYRLAALRGVRTAKIEFPESGLWLDAAAVQVLPVADAATHASQVRVDLPATRAALVPGMFARVHFVLGTGDKLTVPTAAIVRRGEVSGVYVLAGDGKPGLRQLRLGEALANGETEVLAGLAPGERVASDPVKAGIALRGGR